MVELIPMSIAISGLLFNVEFNLEKERSELKTYGRINPDKHSATVACMKSLGLAGSYLSTVTKADVGQNIQINH